MTGLMDSLMQYQKKLDEKTVKEYTEDLYRSIRQLILEEVKLLDKEEVKRHIIDNLCLTKNVTFDLGINSEEESEKDKDYYDDKHKKNTVITKIQKEFSNAFIPTGAILYKLAFHNYNKFDEDSFELLNNPEFIKNVQSILEIECMPITFNVQEYCDMSYRSSFYPYLCFHTNKINIEKESECNSDSNSSSYSFLTKLKEYKEKYDEHEKNEEEAKKIKEQQETLKKTKKDTKELKEKFLEWMTENKKYIFRDIKRVIIKSKIQGLEDYKHRVTLISESEFKDLEEEWQLEELKKNINIENIEIKTGNWSVFYFIFTPSEIHSPENELQITEEEIQEKKTKIEEYKEETRQDILKWATDSKEDIINMFYHFLKLRKYYKEKKENKYVKDYISTDILSVKKYSKFWKREDDEFIDVSRYNGILTQELKDKINEILGVTGFDFKTKYDFCNCGLPWEVKREDCSIYFEDIDDDLKHDETCEYTSNFNCICSDDDYKLYIFFPKIFLN